jgi:CheY-like chemotaxis protein
MNGTIEISSEIDKGSKFTVYLGFNKGETEMKSEIEGFHTQATFFDYKKIEEPNILIVEDNDDNKELMKIYLSKSQYKYTFANDGMEAIELFKFGNFNLVFMDIQMPVIDGYEATREIRKFEKENNKTRIPVIALSAYIQTEDIGRSFNAGCDAYLTKPVSKKKLLSIIERLC